MAGPQGVASKAAVKQQQSMGAAQGAPEVCGWVS
jgi:hypothetical protein